MPARGAVAAAALFGIVTAAPGNGAAASVASTRAAKAPAAATADRATKPLRFVFISALVDEEFFRPVKKGMADAAAMFGVDAVYTGTPGVDVKAQAALVTKAVDEGADGIALQIIDPVAFDDVVAAAMAKGVPVVAFNTDDATPNARLSFVGQNLVEAGHVCGRRAAELVPAGAHVIVSLHDEGISALEDRYAGITAELKAKGISWTRVVTGSQPETAEAAIAAALKSHPDVRFVVCTGQADLEPCGRVLERESAGKGYAAAGFDLSPLILRLIDEGLIKFTIDQQPYVQGFYPVVQLTFLLRYGIRPSNVDSGAFVVTKADAKRVMGLKDRDYR